MIYHAFKISEFRNVDYFDTSNHTQDEFESWKRQYPSSQGYTISHIEKIMNNN